MNQGMNCLQHASFEASRGGRAVFDGMRVEGRVAGMLLQVRAVQTFRNPGAAHIEAIYTFPLPADAVLLSLSVRLGQKLLASCVVGKQEAGERYEEALAGGDAAVMLERTHDGSYCLNFGNLAPGETGEIILCYAQALHFEGDGLRVCIPTVIAPRYGDAVRDAGLEPQQVVRHAILASYPFSLQMRLDGDFADATVRSPSHRIAIAARADSGADSGADGGGVLVSLDGEAALDRDFLLVLTGLSRPSAALVAADVLQPGRVAVLAGFRPDLGGITARPARVKILVDCSGSMVGDSIAAARTALHALVAGLQAGERFSLSRFGSTVAHRSARLWTAGDAARRSAARWIDALNADMGGTDMTQALTSTFALGGAAPADVLLVTDGHIHAIDELIAAARQAGQRLFTVAIGSAVSEHHLRRLAAATGGAIDFVAPGEAVAPAIGRMFARLRSPSLGRLRLVWPDAVSAAWTVLPGTAFTGDTVHVHAAVSALSAGDELRLYGSDADGVEHQIGAALVAAAPAGDTLARMAVHARLGASANAAAGEDLGDRQRRQLACDYRLVTDHTNFLLTIERAAGDKATAMPVLHQVRHMVPAGFAGAGSVRGAVMGVQQPCVWRRESAAPAELMRNAVEQYEIPAFLRPSGDAPPRARGSASPLRRLAKWWSGKQRAATDTSTPLALHTMLASTPHYLWDRRYGDLLASGLDPAVVAWLRATYGALHPEHRVVASFLACMLLPSLWRALDTPTRQRRSRAAAAMPPQADAQLAADMALALTLAGIAAASWPAHFVDHEQPAVRGGAQVW